MRLGWTTWCVRETATGRHFTWPEAVLKCRNLGTDLSDFENIGECLTEEGRRVLRVRNASE